MRLSSINATKYDNDFIYCNADLTIVLSGDNSIDCSKYPHCIDAVGSLKLSGNGTLTVTDNNNQYCGLLGITNYTNSNNLNGTTTEVDVTSLLALDPAKTTVTRGAMRDNGDGTYRWTYTVTTTN